MKCKFAKFHLFSTFSMYAEAHEKSSVKVLMNLVVPFRHQFYYYTGTQLSLLFVVVGKTFGKEIYVGCHLSWLFFGQGHDISL